MKLNPTKTPGELLIRAVAVAVFVTFGDSILALMNGEFALSGLIWQLLGTFCIVLVVAILSKNLLWSLGQRMFALSLAVFTISKVNTTLELFFFSTSTLRELGLYMLLGLVKVLGMCFITCLAFPPLSESSTIKADLASLFSSRGIFGWIVRLSLADVTYVITYFVFGAMAFIYTRPYYTDPSYGLNLKLPQPGIVLKLQLIRSLIYILIAFPLIAGLVFRRLQTALMIGLLLFVAGGLTPLLTNTSWPAALRFYHTIEILFQNFTTGFIFVWLLGRRREKGSSVLKDQAQYVSA